MIDEVKKLEGIILNSNNGSRSAATALKTALVEKGLVLEAAEYIFDQCAVATRAVQTVNKLTVSLSVGLANLAGLEYESNTTQVKVGLAVLDWFSSLGLTRVSKQNMIQKNKVKPHWILESTSKEFSDYSKTLKDDRFRAPVDKGALMWTGVTMTFDNCTIDIVKKARRDKVLHWYRYHEMPLVYAALNRLNKQTYVINRDVLKLIQVKSELNTFIPKKVDREEFGRAMFGLNDVVRKALTLEELQFREQNKWEGDEPQRDLAKNIRKYIDVGSVKYKEVIRKNSARYEFDEVKKLAEAWVKHETINYLYTLDTRGRIYTSQQYLTPLGCDLAKALLMFKDEAPVSAYDLCLHIANCCGVDKLSFDDRVRWVNANADDLYEIGNDPWGNFHLIQKLEIDQQKNLWQALAALVEYVKMTDYIGEHGSEEGFMSRLIIGLDSTSSGTQILTMLTQDDVVAPYVNLTVTPDGKVGDFYTYLANHCHPILTSGNLKRLKGEPLSDNLKWFTQEEVWAEVKRNVAKRNSMTFNYSGTEYGFGTQHLEDKSGYGKRYDEEGNKMPSLGDRLEPEDCFVLGSAMYETCVKHIKGSAELMQWLRDGVDNVSKAGIVSWRLPDGFRAYQNCRKVKSHKGVPGMVGDTKVNIRVEFYSDEGDSYLHRNGIAANYTHSADSYLLREIVRGMPEEAPISTVHDQFSTSTHYVADLIEVAREAYKTVANREVAAEVCADAFGVYRELPSVGNWTTAELDKSEFFIC